MKLTKIKETCIYVSDLDLIFDFYHNTLGLSVISQVESKHIFFKVGESVLLFFNPEDSRQKKSPPAHFGGGKQHFAFEVPKAYYEQTKTEIKSKGIRITDEIVWKSGEESFYFEDPAGNVLEILPDKGIWD